MLMLTNCRQSSCVHLVNLLSLTRVQNIKEYFMSMASVCFQNYNTVRYLL